ncbi:MAG: hypothetical protein HY674_17690 [Chloroflexi bacterium]|nr:hypothetical protein [Chloroflexota bacterium]
MTRLSGINRLRAVKVLEKASLNINRQGKHIFASRGVRKALVPSNNPLDHCTVAAIVFDAGGAMGRFKESR